MINLYDKEKRPATRRLAERGRRERHSPLGALRDWQDVLLPLLLLLALAFWAFATR